MIRITYIKPRCIKPSYVTVSADTVTQAADIVREQHGGYVRIIRGEFQ